MRQSHRPLRRPLLVLPLLLAAAVPCLAQPPARQDGPAPAPSYIFVSPNTRSGLTLAEAVRNLDSAEEVALITAARDVACRLGVAAEVVKTVGNWTDGSEHSVLVKVSDDEPSVRYAEAWLGRRFRQKGVIRFVRRRGGASRMYVIRGGRARGSLARVAQALDASGVDNRTIVPRPAGAFVYVVDFESSLEGSVTRAARRLRGRLTSMRGAAAFTGDDDRAKAQAVFAEVVESYENLHPEVKKECTNMPRPHRLRRTPRRRRNVSARF